MCLLWKPFPSAQLLGPPPCAVAEDTPIRAPLCVIILDLMVICLVCNPSKQGCLVLLKLFRSLDPLEHRWWQASL